MAVTSATVRRSQPRAHSASRGPGERGSPYLGEQSVAWPASFSLNLEAGVATGPAFHFYPDTIESQDISGPIKINETWHVFM